MAKKVNSTKKARQVWTEFKAFITRGNVVDMAVGVIMGSAFGAIVNAVVKILLSLCTWGVPGGINGLVTVLPAANSAQQGLAGIGQSFGASQLNQMTEIYQKDFPLDANPLSGLKSLYTLHGSVYYYNQSAIIDWGTFINAVISFLIIALVLFLIVKIFAYLHKKRLDIEKAEQEAYFTKHPEERPVPVVPGKPAPTEVELLTEIRDSLKNEKK